MMQGGRGRLKVASVSNWEWAKLIATSLGVALSTTVIAFALWWLIMKKAVATPRDPYEGSQPGLRDGAITPIVSQKRVISPDRLSNRKNHNCLTTRGLWSRKPHT